MIIATCPADSYNSSTGQCSNIVFIEQEGLLPALSLADAFFYSGLIIGIWALGFSFSLIRKFIFR